MKDRAIFSLQPRESTEVFYLQVSKTNDTHLTFAVLNFQSEGSIDLFRHIWRVVLRNSECECSQNLRNVNIEQLALRFQKLVVGRRKF